MTTRESLSTFIKLTGPLDSRIEQATGASNADELQDMMADKPTKQSVDLLINSKCSERCSHCFFTEAEEGFISTTPELVEDLRRQIQFFDADSSNVTIYPREATLAMNLLPVFEEQSMDRVLTNGVLLSKRGVIDKLKSFGIEKLAISLHGSKEDHTLITQAPSDFYDLTLKGIEMAIAAGMDVSTFTAVSKYNLGSLEQVFAYANRVGIRETKLLRLIPVGNAQNLPDEAFIDEADLRTMLLTVEAARRQYPNLRISLLGTSFGPNFYSRGMYRYLVGESDVWPNSTYACPWINQQYIGISVGSGKVYPCFEAVSFSETQIGAVDIDGRANVDNPNLTPQSLKENLRDKCAEDDCQYQALCLGGCRITAFSFAKRRGEEDPLYAGQDICLTRTLDKLVEERGGEI